MGPIQSGINQSLSILAAIKTQDPKWQDKQKQEQALKINTKQLKEREKQLDILSKGNLDEEQFASATYLDETPNTEELLKERTEILKNDPKRLAKDYRYRDKRLDRISMKEDILNRAIENSTERVEEINQQKDNMNKLKTTLQPDDSQDTLKAELQKRRKF